MIFILIAGSLALCFSFYNGSDKELKNIFTQEWVYPNLPDSTIKPEIFGKTVNYNNTVLLPDSLRTFGIIGGMGCDKNNNLYVWDDKFVTLWKFSPDGKKLWSKKFKKESKEGSYNMVGPAFAVSKEGKICLGDRITKTLNILDDSGHFINKFKLDMMPAAITFGNDGTIYVVGFEMSYKGNLIHHYTESGKFIGSFCKRISSDAIKYSGNSGRLGTDKEGNIYYAHFYPYEIDKFSKDGILLKSFKREVKNFNPPEREGMIARWTSGIRGLINLNNNYTAVVVCLDVKKNDWGIDFYDTQGNWKGFISNKDLPMYFYYRYSTSDSKGNVYFDINAKPEPVIVKYKVNYKQL